MMGTEGDAALPRATTILMADDDPDDVFLAREALRESEVLDGDGFFAVRDGEELLEFLRRRGRYAGLVGTRLPALILLDLNMPRMDGREALKEIKADPQLKHIPIIVLTTSSAEDDIARTYELGVNSFIVKPVSFERLVSIMKAMTDYWFQVVQLPDRGRP